VILEKIIQSHKECIDNKVEEYTSFLEQSATQEERGDPQISTTKSSHTSKTTDIGKNRYRHYFMSELQGRHDGNDGHLP